MSLDPAAHNITNASLKSWRVYLKQQLLFQRHYRSDLSGLRITDETGCHLHEGILSRADVPASVDWHWKIMHPCNSFLLLPDEHIPHPPSREWAIQRAYERYGRETVRRWFYSLPWKLNPPFELP